jgi:CTP-dependent riboflavin kinase
VAYVALIFNDAQGVEQLRMACPDGMSVRLSDGRLVPADQVQVGSWVVIPDRTSRQVDGIEIGA